MTELLSNIARWIWSKLVLLIIIVLIFLAVAWFQREWAGIKGKLQIVSKLDHQIEQTELELAELGKSGAKLGNQAKKELAKLAGLEKATQKRWEATKRAKKRYNTAANKVKWWSKFTSGGREAIFNKKKAWLSYQACRKSAQASQASLKMLRKAQSGAPWMKHRLSVQSKKNEAEVLHHTRDQILADAINTPGQRLALAVRKVLPKALWTLAAIIVSPFVIKAFLYYALAPLIAKAKAVIVIPDAKGDVEIGESGISTPIRLDPGDELIVHSAYLQAAGVGPGKKTLWLFSWRMPFTSLAAGLYAMVKVCNQTTDGALVTVSPKEDLFDKVCDVQIPEGGAMVIYPRSLIGMMNKDGEAPRIERRWSFRLHSWITFQFRYIVIHGKARVLIKGCRGVRAQKVNATKPSMQDQLATLGFTANLSYSGVRCETFIDYLLGRDTLFNDRFSSAHGYYLTEEVPSTHRKAGIFGRGLEGLVDGFLKALGI